MTEAETKVTRSLSGRVVSNKMDKTVSVLVERKVKHPLIGKVISKSKKFHAHDENNACQEGDIVTITEGRPLSKHRTWVVTNIAKKAN